MHPARSKRYMMIWCENNSIHKNWYNRFHNKHIRYFVKMFYLTLKPTLQLQHFCIITTTIHEILMIPSFNNLAICNNHNFIRVTYCLETMSNDNNGFILKKSCERLRYFLLAEAIECRSRFIEDDDLGIFEKYLCYCKSLFLSTGEANSSLANLRVYTMW